MKDSVDLTPDILLQAYRAGVFPMAEHRDDPEVFWVDPQQRGVIPLDGFHVSRSLRKTLRRGHFTATADTDFTAIVRGCAAREETWINDTIFALYHQLHLRGQAHSVEVWEDSTLVGGVYGVNVGGAFFGESMFSTATDASKVALYYLVNRLRDRGYRLFDTQFITPHLQSLGGVEIPRAAYHAQLDAALIITASFGPSGPMADA